MMDAVQWLRGAVTDERHDEDEARTATMDEYLRRYELEASGGSDEIYLDNDGAGDGSDGLWRGGERQRAD